MLSVDATVLEETEFENTQAFMQIRTNRNLPKNNSTNCFDLLFGILRILNGVLALNGKTKEDMSA